MVLNIMTEEYLQELITRYAEGKASPEEARILTDWYRSSINKEVQWPSAARDEKDQVYNRVLSILRREIKTTRTPVRRMPWLRAAALIFIIASAATLVYLLKPATPAFTTISNPSGKVAHIILPDSSSVWLNASTTIHYHPDFINNRYIKLEGEAYFEVSHDPKHPFVVSTREIESTVLGTTFNIDAYEASPSVTISLITGKLKVEQDLKQLAVLKPMKTISVMPLSGKYSISAVDSIKVLAWKNGKLRFEGESLADIALDLERWYGVDIDLAPAISSCRYYLNFENDVSLEEVLRAMSELSTISYTIIQKKVIISGASCN